MGSLFRFLILAPYSDSYLSSLFCFLILVPYLGSLFGFLIWVPYSGSLFGFLIRVPYLGSLFGFLIQVPYSGSLLGSSRGHYRVTFKEWPPYSAGKCAFFEVYHTLWDIITPNKPILVKNEL